MNPTNPGAPLSLARMKMLAVGLLVLAGVVYAAATLLEPRHSAWGYVAAAAEAAMIGALADWFAVVALFRHPLGLPIPHTAIIVANKDRLGAQLARFLDEHFLAAEHVQPTLARWDMAAALGQWLARPDAARRVGRWLQQATPALLGALDQTPARQWVAQLAQRLLREVDLATLGGQALAALTAHGHHQQWLNGLLQQLSGWAGQEAVQEKLTDAIARELKELKYVGLDQMAARLATRKLVAALTRTLADVAADPDHELRHRFDGWMTESINRLQTDPDWQARVALWRDAWLAQPQWKTPIEAWWHELMGTLRADAVKPESALGERIASVVQAAGQQLQADATLRAWLNTQAQQVLLSLLDSSRETIVGFVAQRVQAWDAHDMSRTLENNIGRDLQFIRINGTLVGALVGLLLHALTQAVLALPAVQAWMG
ncbi:MAG: DUF445 domain-containing protein [Hydrogenophaga sp.]|uniref:DUF445 domain-containing protein n=1 Tax=Hydrogenophaga sp. TaxID=1904254 RepID=UPI001BC2678D|nr:DUF445 domain-containing protein [Hydrogenophaga sp.]MBS3912109.1 DUF445 domain-containing protein [Hydrogenophaga sp.]MDP2163757.1 DUF445 domain-containing protein [Hydrogenophaga sp.]MDP3475897.1 DUF445 domain-containing protein [Hydrogenophaga sp.]